MPKNEIEVKPIEVMLATVPQAAQLLAISERHVWALIKNGELPSIHIGGSRRVEVDELRRFATKGSPLHPTKAAKATA